MGLWEQESHHALVYAGRRGNDLTDKPSLQVTLSL